MTGRTTVRKQLFHEFFDPLARAVWFAKTKSHIRLCEKFENIAALVGGKLGRWQSIPSSG